MRFLLRRLAWAWLFLAPWAAAQVPAVTINGTVTNVHGQALCAMVLINGQYMFSCGGNGEYQLTFPLDANRQATVFSFVDGLAPYRQVVTPSQLNTTVNIGMSPSTGAPGPLVTLTSVVPQADGWVALAGQVRNGQGQPLCAMVLANGQYMFSCGGQGAFNLTVPRAPDGSITLFTFVDGMSPYRSTFTP